MMATERFGPGFRELLESFGLEQVERYDGVIYGLWPDHRLAYFNPAWFRFAEENDGEPSISRDWPLGRRVDEAVPEELRPFFQEFFGSLFQRQVRNPLRHDYECSSADVFRLFHMTAYPLGGGRAVLVVNHLVVETPHDRDAHELHGHEAQRYVHPDGAVRQCAHCRCVQVAGEDRWDWVPRWVRLPPTPLRAVVCPFCRDHYTSELRFQETDATFPPHDEVD